MAKRIAPKTIDTDKLEAKQLRKLTKRNRNLERSAKRDEKYVVLSQLIMLSR